MALYAHWNMYILPLDGVGHEAVHESSVELSSCVLVSLEMVLDIPAETSNPEVTPPTSTSVEEVILNELVVSFPTVVPLELVTDLVSVFSMEWLLLATNSQ